MSKDKSVRSLSDLSRLFPGADAPDERQEDSRTNRALSFVTLHVLWEKKGRKGNGVTVVNGFHHAEEDLKELARELKTLCGAGGTVKGQTIEVQGRHLEKVTAHLKGKGYKVIMRRYG